MNKTLLQLIQEVTARTGLVKPVAVVGNQDKQIRQFLGLANELVEELVNGYYWQELSHTADWTSPGTKLQGELTTLAPEGFLEIRDGTFFDLTQRIQVFGPLSNTNWQARRALPATGPYYQYRVIQGELFTNPAVPAGHSLSFEYKSQKAIIAADASRKSSFTVDSDTCVFPDMLILAGLRWKWRQEKRLEFASDLARFNAMARQLSGADGSKSNLRMDGSNANFQPGIFVPSGSWNIS